VRGGAAPERARGLISVNVAKQLRDFRLEVAFEVGTGECLALVGPTGCGKTTILRIIAGLEVPDVGSVRIDDAVLVDATTGVFLPPQQRHLGMVFQDFALFPHMTVLGNAAYGARARGLGTVAADEEARKAIGIVGMTEHERVRPGQLSGGQRQRVALARALASQPRALLMDEPMSALDASTRRQVRGQLSQLLSGLGLQTIIVTHDVVDALTVGDRVCVMNDGKVVQVGTRAELLSEPRTPFVAEFMGVNLLSGCMTRDSTGALVAVCGGSVFRASEVLDDAGEGAEAHVTFSPADVLLVREPPVGWTDNILSGQVDSITHLGTRSRITVRNEATVVAEIAYTDESRLDLRVGDRVHACIPQSALKWYR